MCGNIPFHTEIGRMEANRLIRIAEDLSYNQMCILAFVNEIQDPYSETSFRGIPITLKEGYIYHDNDGSDFSFSIFANELEDISNKKLVGALGEISSGSNVPRDMKLTIIGKKLCNLMEISKIDTVAIRESIKFIIRE